ncbi:MAG: SH3 domain-containing protein [Bacteroidota bacterium]|nr:SH3 domain-containing protein [Bacteroidota bacterium]
MRLAKFLILIIVVSCFAFSAYGQKTIAPRNEVSQDPTLSAFVTTLQSAIEKKDAKWIYSVLDKDVVSTYGDEPTLDVFKTYWDIENDSTNFWAFLKRAVNMGGVFLHDTADHTGKYEFVFPYAYDIDMEMDDDYYMLGAITGKNVNLRSGPNQKADVITQLTYNVISYIYDDADEKWEVPMNANGEPQWFHITTYDKKYTGWVNWQYVYSPMRPRLFLFKNDKGIWYISAFVAGD